MQHNRISLLLFGWICALSSWGQTPVWSKMSSLIRQVVVEQKHEARRMPGRHRDTEICALVRLSDRQEDVLTSQGARILARVGNIYVAALPVSAIARLSALPSVERIEAGKSRSLTLDTMGVIIRSRAVHAGTGLPQAFTGKGVVMGIMDVGFDLTHPTFFDTTATRYRIRRFWDQLSVDTIGSTCYVGADYTTEDAIRAYRHSRDNLIQSHGTHTLGIAGGSGYDSPYRGLAYESDLCLVNNAVQSDIGLIDSAKILMYTYATDALGFKYIFDYAASVGKPCVINFSEGSYEDFRGDDVLYYEMLDSLVGPGRILVASAGNEGNKKTFFRKPAGVESMGTFVYSPQNSVVATVKSKDDFAIRTTIYGNGKTTVEHHTADMRQAADGEYSDSIRVDDYVYRFDYIAYRSAYDSTEWVIDYRLSADSREIGGGIPVSVEVKGTDADVEYYRASGYLLTNELDPQLDAGEKVRNVHSPGSAPRVICAGATGYRTGVTNYLGENVTFDQGNDGRRSSYSSVGPTYDGRVKPDVMAPGTNIISSYSSYYMEANPYASDLKSNVATFDFDGRTYAWNCNSGTSMATPAVAGAIALWLQANPLLTPEDILGIFSRTCRQYDAALPHPNNEYGYGEIDVYRGMLDVLGQNGIAEEYRQTTALGIEIDALGRSLSLISASPVAHSFKVKLVSLEGKSVLQRQLKGGNDRYAVDVSRLPRGVFVLLIEGDAEVKGSQLIRI